MSITLGQAIWAAVKPIIKIYLIMASGFTLAKMNILTAEATRIISDIVLTLLLPTLVFYNVVTEIQDADIKQVGIVCLTSVMLFSTGGFFAWVVSKLLPVPRKWRHGILAGGIFPNISDLPIAYIQTLDSGLVFTKEQGSRGVSHVIIFLAMFTVCLFNLGGFQLIEWDFNYEEPDIENSIEKVPTLERQMDSAVQHDLVPTPSDSDSLSEGELEARAIPSDLHVSTRTSIDSSGSSLTRRRTLEIRGEPSQGMSDIIREYSNVDNFGRITQDNASIASAGNLRRIITSDATVSKKDIIASAPKWWQRYGGHYAMFFLKNCLRPCSIAIIASLVIAFIPWLKALFVHTNVHMPDAPDDLPPLSFIMDFTSYVGAASVPFGLLLLGATMARLKFNKLAPGFWKASLALVLLRLCVMPIFGVLWCRRLVDAGWVDAEKDRMLLFVIMIDWALPSMTTLIYFTASYTPVDATDTTQMDCCSLFLLMQYPIMVVSLPFLVTYALKVEFKL